jgi:O-antigen/teichoic acid export membrane protein
MPRSRAAWVVVPASRMGLLGLWFLGQLLIIRTLPAAEVGIYALCVAFIRVLSGFLGDTLDLAVLRKAPTYLVDDRPRGLDVIRAAFWIRVGAGTALGVLGALAAPVLARTYAGGAENAGLVVLAATGVLGDLLVRSALGYFQAAGVFSRYLAVEAVMQVGRFVAVATLAALGLLSVGATLVILVAAQFVAFAVGLALLPRDVVRISFPAAADLIDVLHYGKWMIVALGAGVLYDNLDVLLLGSFRPQSEVGILAAALALARVPDFIEGCLVTVLHPRVVDWYRRGEFMAVFRRYLAYSVPLTLLGLTAALALGGPLIRLLGADKVAALPAFRILVVGSFAWLALGPLPTALVALERPRWNLLLCTGALVGKLTAGALVIPAYGFMGAAVVSLAMRLVLTVLVIGFARRVVAPGAHAVAAFEPSAGDEAERIEAIT